MQDVKAAIDAALLRPSPWSFAPTLEARYEAAVGPVRRRHLRAALLICAACVMAALALEAPHTEADFVYLLAWRGAATLVMAAAALAARRVRAAWQEAALVTVAALAGMAVLEIIGEHAVAAAAASYMLAAIALVAGMIASSQVRFSTAVVSCLNCAVAFPLVMLAFPGALPLGAALALPAGAVMSFAVLLIAARRNDINRRSEYLHRLRHEIVEIEMKALNDELLRLSTTDMLTGLSNRRHFEQQAGKVWEDRDRAPFVLAIVDVDRFKAFNDTAGHAAGDACLVAVAHALEAAIRGDKDRVARYGGEEFVVLFPGAAVGATVELGERLRIAVEALRIPHPGLPGQQVTISIGIVRKDGRCGSFDALLSEADRLLYLAKETGRNRVCSGWPVAEADPRHHVVMNALRREAVEDARADHILDGGEPPKI
jgi:diguanylate cyclase (GGDEF)-like protein